MEIAGGLPGDVPERQLQDHTAYVTGGSSGIGLGIAIALVECGARVGLIGTSRDKLASARTMLSERGGTVATAVLDVADADAWAAATQSLQAAVGPPDSLVLNAGIGTEGTPIESAPAALWRWTFEVNVMGVVNGLVSCLPGMRARGRRGHILITSSIAALRTPAGLAPYSASKAAGIAIAETLRSELQDTALATSVLVPAAVRTDFVATSGRDAPAAWETTAKEQSLERMRAILIRGLDPVDVGRYSVAAMLRGEFYIFTHPAFREQLVARYDELLAAIPRSQPLKLP